MSIIIKGMEMPKNCLSCPLQGGTADCRLTQKTYNWGLTERPSDCPLVPVPPHGRLIDADAVLRRYDYELSRTYNDDFAKGFQLGVKAAVGNGTAVVIEAEEGE